MASKFVRCMAIGFGILLLALPTLAQTFSGNYDASNEITLNGVIKRLDWLTPHSYVYIDVPSQEGVETWAVEGGDPDSLASRGWTRDLLKPGDSVTVIAYAQRGQAGARQVRS